MTEYSDMVRLIREASYASDAVDYFDLHGDDPAMQATWKWLLKEQRDAFLALVTHIRAHSMDIIAALGDPVDAPADPPPATKTAHDIADWVYVALTTYAIAAERATADPTAQTPDPKTLPLPLKRRWKRVNRQDGQVISPAPLGDNPEST